VFNLPYIAAVKNCEEINRRITNVISHCHKQKVDLAPVHTLNNLDRVASEWAAKRKMVRKKQLIYYLGKRKFTFGYRKRC